MSTTYYVAKPDGEDGWECSGDSLFSTHGAGGGAISITWHQLPCAVMLALLDQAEDRLKSDDAVAIKDEYGNNYGMSDLYAICRKAVYSKYVPAAITRAEER